MANHLPLENVKICDFMWVMAGPASTRILADYGATVVRIESPTRIDTARTLSPYLDNNLGPEGPGLQVLFLCPTPMRTIMLAKNLFHALLFLADAVLVCVVASLRIGWPAPAAIAATASWLLFALPVHLAAGNAFSLAMPYRMNLGRITRQRGSQANALFSMLIQLGVLGLGAGIMAVCLLFGNLWMAVPVLLVLAAAAIFFWIRALDHIDAMAGRRRESLMSTLVRTE